MRREVLLAQDLSRMKCSTAATARASSSYRSSGWSSATPTGFELVEWRYFHRAAVPGWWWSERVLKRRSFSRVQLKIFDLAVPLLRHVDQLLPWRGLGLIAIARRVEAPPG